MGRIEEGDLAEIATGYADVAGAVGSQLQLSLELGQGSAPLPSRPTRETQEIGVTFRDSLKTGAFGWYPYVEGFSAAYINNVLTDLQPNRVYDPFGGSGTTNLAAALRGIPSWYSELNPFMRFVANAKVNGLRAAQLNPKEFRSAAQLFMQRVRSADFAKKAKLISLSDYELAFPSRDFFAEVDLQQLILCRDYASEYANSSPHVADLLKLAVAANVVKCSHMTRRADLRRRRADEYKNRVVDVAGFVTDSVARMLLDISEMPPVQAQAAFVSEDARFLPAELHGTFDCALTSPPYLNGTNYFRNTKLELWLLKFIQSEKDLTDFTKKSIAGGINSVRKNSCASSDFSSVEKVAKRLDDDATDRRIPTLVRQYFADMHEVLLSVRKALTPKGRLILDIGDSKFYGVHVPTHDLLADVAEAAGLHLAEQNLLAKRYSRDKSELVQVEMVFTPRSTGRRKSHSPGAKETASSALTASATRFHATLPFRDDPYRKKTWGHKFHSLCSYQGKLKPAMAHWLVREFVPKNGRLLDPLGGVGTVPFEGAMQGFESVSNDKSPFAYTIASAKLNPPEFSQVKTAWDRLFRAATRYRLKSVDFDDAEFGLNGPVKDFFHPDTLKEVLAVRRVLMDEPAKTPEYQFIRANLLHILHGNRPYALSRQSHPITPFSPTGPAEYKSVYDKFIERAESVLAHDLPASFQRGNGLNLDFRELPKAGIGRFDCIITSPPFYGMRFDRPNWLRLWFCGWNEQDFSTTSLGFLERQQTKSLDCYNDFFDVCHTLLRPGSPLIMHIGSGGKRRLDEEIAAAAGSRFTLRYHLSESVTDIANHGIKDKGLTDVHHLVFLERR
ncbi:hypothetical protein [Burkholderia cepacia]|uniref:hypothetical protein n=1 Tax=Burkholderia cepacia TaxID=292 RepID=UPI002FE0AD26